MSLDKKSCRERYIHAAAIDMVSNQGIWNIMLNGSFKFKQTKITGTIPTKVARKIQTTPWFHKKRPVANEPCL